MSKVIHFEIAAEKPERAMQFYESVFGWTFNHYEGQPYWLVKAGKDGEPGINGAIQPRRQQSQPVVNTINVESIDQTVKKIEKNGGVIIVPRTEVPGIGLMVYFKDTEGNVFCAMQPFPMK